LTPALSSFLVFFSTLHGAGRSYANISLQGIGGGKLTTAAKKLGPLLIILFYALTPCNMM
jgi:hypothetical protein